MSDQDMFDQDMSDHDMSDHTVLDFDVTEPSTGVFNFLAQCGKRCEHLIHDMGIFNFLARCGKGWELLFLQCAGGVIIGTMFLCMAQMRLEIERKALLEGLLAQAQNRGDAYGEGLKALRSVKSDSEGWGGLPKVCSDAICHYRATELVQLYQSCLEPTPPCFAASHCDKAVVCRNTPVLVTYLTGLVEDCPLRYEHVASEESFCDTGSEESKEGGDEVVAGTILGGNGDENI